jgi:hypothetical protein
MSDGRPGIAPGALMTATTRSDRIGRERSIGSVGLGELSGGDRRLTIDARLTAPLSS